MNYLAVGLLLFVGLLNLVPVVGVLSAEQLTRLYGMPFQATDLQVLMRHRAVMLGLIGAFVLYSVWRPDHRMPALILATISMALFVVLAWSTGSAGLEIHNVARADVAGTIAAAIAMYLEWRRRETL